MTSDELEEEQEEKEQKL